MTNRSRVGLVGDNGVGKTTLLRILAGQAEADSGSVEIAKGIKTGYLPQDLVELEDIPIFDHLRRCAGLAEMQNDLADLEDRITRSSPDSRELTALLAEHERLQRTFEHAGGFEFEPAAHKVLHGLGFKMGDAYRSCAEFSGGWKMRIALAALLLARPDVLLLDEPTNHLDSESMEWFEGWLRDHRGALVFVSHDRRFLEKMATEIAELARGRLTTYSFGYDKYIVEKAAARERLQQTIEDQKERIEQIQRFVDRFRYKSSKATQVQSRIKQLEKMEIYELDGLGKEVSFHFPEASRSHYDVLKGIDLAKQYGDVTVFGGVDLEIHRGEKVALVGVNGAGKSTLLRLLSETEKPTSGHIVVGERVKRAYFSQESAQNVDYARTIWGEATNCGSKLSEVERRNLLGAFLFSGDDIHKPISVLSGGEKSRVALFKLLLSDANFLILDEPTNHLDMNTKELFQKALLQYTGTLLIVSHDRSFLDDLADRVIEIRDGRLFDYPGNYSWFIERREKREKTEKELREAGEYASNGNGGKKKKPIGPEGIVEAFYQEAQNARDQKRLEADERNRLHRLRKAILHELSPLESLIESHETRREEIDSALCTPEGAGNSELIQSLMVERSEIELQLTQHYARWEELTEALDSVR